MTLQEFHVQSQKLKTRNRAFFNKLKRNTSKNLDVFFHRAHAEVFEHTDCLKCANCCKTTSPIFYQIDIERVAKALQIKPGVFIQQYLYMDEEGDFVLKQAPCPFLDQNNYCQIYESRPKACKEYPHTDRKKMQQILDLTFQNTLVCPAVLAIVERVEVALKSS